MKKLLLFPSMVTLLILIGCSDSDSKEEAKEPKDTSEETKKEDAIKSEENSPIEIISSSADLGKDFEEYVDKILLLAPEEERIIGIYDSVTGENYVNDEILHQALTNEILPGYRQFVIDLEAIMPQNEEIRTLHETYIDAANIQYNAFTLMIFALEEQDMDAVTEANEGLDQARKMIRDWLYGMEELQKKLELN